MFKMSDVKIDLKDEPSTPRREFALSKKEFDLFTDAANALDKANEQRFDGTWDRNEEISFGLSSVFAKKLPNTSGPEKLIPKDPNEPLQVIAVKVRENVEVYWVYMRLGQSCEKVQLTDSKASDFYDIYNPPSWYITNS
jgi:hypothetical protein